MVSQCANPACEAQFLYFGEGQLITVRRYERSSAKSAVEFFWLCGDCVMNMSLEFVSNGNMNLVPRHPQSRTLREVGYEFRPED
ncbi:MAG TPA: hypothetical protein VFK06_25805 [Candidatus Angelobacter sp.]|nr:hypothetical protein [Candidatus Angelobacter sp.]